MAEKRWTNLNPDNVNREPSRIGVYLLKNGNDKILYIGKGNIRESLQDHLPDGSRMFEGANKYYYRKAKSEAKADEAEKDLLDYFKELHGDFPQYNGGKPSSRSSASAQKMAPASEMLDEDLEEKQEDEAEEDVQILAEGLEGEEEAEEEKD